MNVLIDPGLAKHDTSGRLNDLDQFCVEKGDF